MIPKIIHQVWVGDCPVPEADIPYCESLKRNHPDWKFVLHATHREHHLGGPWDDVRDPPATMVDHVIDFLEKRSEKKARPAAISDVYRLAAIYEEGGVYFDTDVLCLKPIDDAMRGVELALSYEYDCHTIGNFFIAAKPHHWRIVHALNQIRFRCKAAYHEGGEVRPINVTGPQVVQRALAPEGQDHGCHVFPYEVFSPWDPFFDLPHDLNEVPWPSATLCVHMFAGRWSSRWESVPSDQMGPKNIRYATQPKWG